MLLLAYYLETVRNRLNHYYLSCESTVFSYNKKNAVYTFLPKGVTV